MNLFDRFTRVAKANLNNLLQKLEDPEKVLGQAVEDLQKDLIKIRQSYAEVMATQKRMQRQRDQAAQMADEWYKRAQLALEKEDEELAREALTRKSQHDDQVANFDAQISTQTDSLNKLYESMQTLENKIEEAKSTKDQYVARARTAKTATKVNDMLSSVTGTTSMDAFDRMKEKVEMLETQAEVAGELTAGTATSISSEQKFKALEAGSKVDDELAKLKAMKALPPSGHDDKLKDAPGVVDAAPEPGSVEDELQKLKNASA